MMGIFPPGHSLYSVEDAGLPNVTESDAVKPLIISQTTVKEGAGKLVHLKLKEKIIRMMTRQTLQKRIIRIQRTKKCLEKLIKTLENGPFLSSDNKI